MVLRGTYEGVKTWLAPTLPEIPASLDALVTMVAGEEVVRGRAKATQTITK